MTKKQPLWASTDEYYLFCREQSKKHNRPIWGDEANKLKERLDRLTTIPEPKIFKKK